MVGGVLSTNSRVHRARSSFELLASRQVLSSPPSDSSPDSGENPQRLKSHLGKPPLEGSLPPVRFLNLDVDGDDDVEENFSPRADAAAIDLIVCFLV